MNLIKKRIFPLIFIFVLCSLLNTTFLIWYSSHSLSSIIFHSKRYHVAEQSIYKKHILSNLTSKGIDSNYNYLSLINDPREGGIDSFFLDNKGKVIGSHSLSDNLQATLISIVSQLNDSGIKKGYTNTKEQIPVYFQSINNTYWLITISFPPIVETPYEVSKLIIISIGYSIFVNIFVFSTAVPLF